MPRLTLEGEEVAFEEIGEGEPLLLVHAGVFSEWFAPLATSTALAGFRCIRLQRAGYVTGYTSRPLSLADHARHCVLLLDALGIARAHLCGHSSSALILLQLAIDHPDRVQSLTLLDPAPGGALVDASYAPVIGELIGPAMAAYAAGDVASGFTRFMDAACGAHHREVMLQRLGEEGYHRAVRESSYFPEEAIAVQTWQFTASDAARITAPTLLVDGGRTAQVATIRPETVTRLSALMPHAERTVLPDVSHLMPLEDPEAVAEVLAAFVRRHPISGERSSRDSRAD